MRHSLPCFHSSAKIRRINFPIHGSYIRINLLERGNLINWLSYRFRISLDGHSRRRQSDIGAAANGPLVIFAFHRSLALASIPVTSTKAPPAIRLLRFLSEWRIPFSFFLSFVFSAMAWNEIFFFLPSTGCLVDDAIPGENRSSPPSRRRSKTW